jgi:hypothetical protein
MPTGVESGMIGFGRLHCESSLHQANGRPWRHGFEDCMGLIVENHCSTSIQEVVIAGNCVSKPFFCSHLFDPNAGEMKARCFE